MKNQCFFVAKKCNFVLSAGAEGSAYVGCGKYVKVACFKADAVDMSAGDTYAGALVTRLSEGADIEEAMTFASKASAITVTRRATIHSV